MEQSFTYFYTEKKKKKSVSVKAINSKEAVINLKNAMPHIQFTHGVKKLCSHATN